MIGRKRCQNCNKLFTPRPQCKRQAFCHEVECRKESKRVSQQKWSDKNPDYWKGRTANTQQWRRNHPGYWRSKSGSPSKKKSGVLQDCSSADDTDNQKDKPKNGNPEVSALQDFWISQIAIIYGLSAQFIQEPLQETIDSFLQKLQYSGSEILGIPSGVLFTELTRRYCHEAKENTTRTGAGPPSA